MKKKRTAGSALAIALTLAVPMSAQATLAPPDGGTGGTGGTSSVYGCEGCSDSECVITSYHYNYSPGYVTNAVAGDGVLYSGPGITAMLGLGYKFTHIGTASTTYYVRHNTTSLLAMANAVQINLNLSNIWNKIISGIGVLLDGAYGTVTVDKMALYNMAPGLVTEPIDASSSFGFGKAYTNTWRSSISLLKPTSTRRTDAKAVNTWMVGNSRYYRVHAYDDLNTSDATGGNVCSGTLASASTKITRTASSAMAPYSLPSADTSLAIRNLQAALFQTIRWDVVDPTAPGILGSGKRNDIAHGLTDQVINCFLYHQSSGCSMLGNGYLALANANSLPPAKAVSPDFIAFGKVTKPGTTTTEATFNAGPYAGAAIQAPTWSAGVWTTQAMGYCGTGGDLVLK
jgi:hypothetical protein